ncbi:MAG: hypothetical protein RJP95_04370 [Pirellulales bacterium]
MSEHSPQQIYQAYRAVVIVMMFFSVGALAGGHLPGDVLRGHELVLVRAQNVATVSAGFLVLFGVVIILGYLTGKAERPSILIHATLLAMILWGATLMLLPAIASR